MSAQTSDNCTAGYTAALADVCRLGGGDIATELLENSGMTFKEIVQSGADEYDTDEIKKLYWKGK